MMDGMAVLANYLLVVAGIGGIIVASLTLRKIERQTKAGEDAANAALLNAQALINAERPWLVVEASGFPYITLKMVNKGRTPAQLIWYSKVLSVSDHLLAEPMGEPHYGKYYDEVGIQIMNVPMIFPDGDMPAGGYSVTVLQQEFPERWKEICAKKRQLHIYSAIKYKGPLSNDVYVTKYCFLVKSTGAVMSGDPGYNHHT
jgi:hypothetical protein